MKVNKQKRHRKAVRFYTACFGFREPFKVLCDGTFVHHLLVNRITPADTALSNALGAPVKIFTSRCVLAELKSLGGSYSGTLDAACNLITGRCDHEKRKSAVACITEVIGENNSEHFFVATQDADLRKKFQEVPGVPVLYALRNALFLERPSAFQHQFAKSSEEARSHMSESELNRLKMKKKKELTNDDPIDSCGSKDNVVDQILDIQNVNRNDRRKTIDMKDKVQFKRKKAKGPNPLSCQKKKTGASTISTIKHESKNTDGTIKNKRKRKRSHKVKNVQEKTV